MQSRKADVNVFGKGFTWSTNMMESRFGWHEVLGPFTLVSGVVRSFSPRPATLPKVLVKFAHRQAQFSGRNAPNATKTFQLAPDDYGQQALLIGSVAWSRFTRSVISTDCSGSSPTPPSHKYGPEQL